MKEPIRRVRKNTKEVISPLAAVEEEGHEMRTKILIIGEGPTEAAYFMALCGKKEIESKFVPTILPEKNSTNSDGHKGSTVKGLLYMAMQKQKEARLPYEEIWIVVDNDEQNAYKWDKKSIAAFAHVVDDNILKQIESLESVSMDIREDESEEEESEEERTRTRFFLSEIQYKEFLQSEITGISEDEIESVIEHTTKKNDLELLFSENRKAIFYDENNEFIKYDPKGNEKWDEANFDKACLDKIHVAYSSISFEHWILLHFERNKHGFYNSREIIKYYDDKKYFFSAGGGRFKKGWSLYSKRDESIYAAFYANISKAINNNIWLNGIQNAQGGLIPIYELNPYSTVFCLVGNLLNIHFAILGENIQIEKNYDFLLVSADTTELRILIKLEKTQSELISNICDGIKVYDSNKVNMISSIMLGKEKIIRTGDDVELVVELKQKKFRTPYFISFQPNNLCESIVCYF